MSRVEVHIDADRVEFGDVVGSPGNQPQHQAVRLFNGGECVCRLVICWPKGAQHAGAVQFSTGSRDAGERD